MVISIQALAQDRVVGFRSSSQLDCTIRDKSADARRAESQMSTSWRNLILVRTSNTSITATIVDVYFKQQMVSTLSLSDSNRDSYYGDTYTNSAMAIRVYDVRGATEVEMIQNNKVILRAGNCNR